LRDLLRKRGRLASFAEKLNAAGLKRGRRGAENAFARSRTYLASEYIAFFALAGCVRGLHHTLALKSAAAAPTAPLTS